MTSNLITLSNLGLDVVRTDRTLVFYENEANQAKLWDVLAVYAWMDKDIGYVQGNHLGYPKVQYLLVKDLTCSYVFYSTEQE